MIRPTRTTVEFGFLIALILFLPIAEAPKNIFWLLFVGTWVFNRIALKDWGGKWDIWDTLISIWFVSALASVVAAALDARSANLTDIIRYLALLWIIKRSLYNPRQIITIGITIALSTSIALIHAYWSQYVSHTEQFLELNSVGHFNHSAIYILISLGSIASFTLAYWKTGSPMARYAGLLATLFLSVSVVFTFSRAAAGTAALLVLLFAIIWARRSKLIASTIIILFVMGGIGIYITQPPILEKHQHTVQADNVLSSRDKIWNASWLAFAEYPVFGLGINNYGLIDDEKIERWALRHYQHYDAPRYRLAPHAHNLYINTLVERGVVGLLGLLAFLVALGLALARKLPRSTDSDLYWAVWGGAFTAWFTALVVGLVNTTLHHEHAILSMVLFGIFLQLYKNPASSAAHSA